MLESKLIKEGRKENFNLKYAKKFNPEQLKRVVSMVQPKFLDWVGKNLDAIDFDRNFAKINSLLDFFERNSSNLPITDLYQYKSANELENAIEEFQKRQRRVVKKVKGGNVVYEDDRFFIVNPLTHDASCYYGKGTKWCTASESQTHFNATNEDGKLFYVIDKTLPTSDNDYKVAILKKYGGDVSYWNAIDTPIKSGWIFQTEGFNEIMSAIDQYMEDQFGENLKIFRDKEQAKKEKERLYQLRIRREREERLAQAEERRIENEWELGPDCPEEGLLAHALFDYLVDNNEIEPLTNEDRIEIDRIKTEIERLNSEYDNDEETRTDLLDEISDLEDELEYLESHIDVYCMIPVGRHYYMTTFRVIPSDIESNEYAVGDARAMQNSAEEYVEQMINDIGYMGFSRGFAENYIDEDAVMEFAQSFYEDDVNQNPDAYFEDEERMLSDDQEETIQINKNKIASIERLIKELEGRMDGENDDEIQEKIDDLNNDIDELNDEISDIESSPDGDFPDELIENKVEDLVDDVKNNIGWFMQEFGLNVEDYIDKEDFIEGVIDADGYGIINGYDGSVDELYVQDILFYVMRID